MIISLSSLSISFKKFSNFSKNSIFALGGRYQVEISSGLLYGFLTSILSNSRVSCDKSLRMIYGITVLIYIATPPPFLFRSDLIIS